MTADKFGRLREVAGPVSRETFQHLLAFEAEFLRWAERVNLAAPSTLDDLWERHVLDSAQLLRLAPCALSWLDLGSGGGFPGAILAILLRDRQRSHIDLVESNNKKATFLRMALARSGSAGTVHACRIENVRVDPPHVLTARALAPLPSLLSLSSSWLTTGSVGLFHKGRGFRAEVEESRDVWHFDLVEHPSMVAAESVILEVRGLREL